MTIVNAHTHVYSALAPYGMPAPQPAPANFLEILERVWWRLDRALDEQSLRASARLYAAESLALGTAAIIDHHESPGFIEGSLDVIADACEDVGLYAVICYGATERNGGREEARRGLAECERFFRSNERPRVRGAVGLHAGFTVSDETMREAAELARELGTVLHVHVAEDASDVEDARRRGYAGCVDRMRRLDALVPGSIFAHGVHLTEAEVRECAEHGCWLVQNPRSNANNNVGYPDALAASDLVALGTDGFPSDMGAEHEALCVAAVEHGDDVEAAAGRLAGGSALLEGILEAPLHPAPPLSTDELEARRAAARSEAVGLWRRFGE